MKQFLLSGLLIAATAGAASAVDLSPAKFTPKEVNKSVSATTRATAGNPKLNKPVLRQLPKMAENKALDVKAVRHISPKDDDSEVVFFESFEEWPVFDENDEQDFGWLPEGWTRQGNFEGGDMASWFPMYYVPYYGYPAPADGQYYYMILPDEEQDEWLITPEIEVGEGMDLSYYLFYQPYCLFSSDNIDFDSPNYEYEGDKIVVCNFQVYVKAEGEEEWTKIQDMADKYKDYTNGLDLMYANPTGMVRQVVSLSDYAGKKVQFGFRYTTTDEGDTMWFDAVRVGISGLDNVSYSLPAHTFYWGLDNDFTGMMFDVAQVPVYWPITFFNTSEDEATFTWEYIDPVTGMATTNTDQTDLKLTYQPDYSSEETLANNLYDVPTLSASAPGKATTEYKPDMFLQAGGKSVFEEDGDVYDLSIFPFALNQDDLGGIAVFDSQIGDPSIPVFGHNMHTNEYWFNYTANGDEDVDPESCYNHLEGIANIYMPELGQTVVVNEISVFGYGLFNDDAEVKFTIYGLKALYDEDGDYMGISNDPEDFSVVATATTSGSDILYVSGIHSQKDHLCIPFVFDKPAVVTSTEEYPAFFFMLEGFNSDAVEYFEPWQTINTAPGSMSLAFMMSHIDFQAATGRPAYYSIKPLVYKEEGEYYDPATSFAFGLKAEFPWLTCDTEEISLGVDDETAEVALGSYYDGSDLTVDAPEGLEATVEGQYDKCMLTVSRVADFTEEIEGVLTVKGPGVEVTMAVHADKASGIDEVISSDAEATDAFDLLGRPVKNPSNGVYIVKYNDGSVSKKVVVE